MQRLLPIFCEPRFNPTMVRLRPIHHPHRNNVLTVSIPLWCDCDCRERRKAMSDNYGFNPTMVRLRLARAQILSWYCQVSIPLWCDCDNKLGVGWDADEALSIPLWCDCDEEVGTAFCNVFRAFNPTMVRLRLEGNKEVMAFVWEFQSHYGAIATRRCVQKMRSCG